MVWTGLTGLTGLTDMARRSGGTRVRVVEGVGEGMRRVRRKQRFRFSRKSQEVGGKREREREEGRKEEGGKQEKREEGEREEGEEEGGGKQERR